MRSQEGCDPFGRKDLYVFLMNWPEISRLQTQGGESFLDLPEGLRESLSCSSFSALSGQKSLRDARHGQKFCPGQGDRVHLAHIGQDLVDIAAENGVEGHQDNFIWTEGIPLAVKKPGDALQEDTCLAASCDAVDKQDRDIFMAHDRVLLLLDGCRDRLHLVTALPGERPDEERILYSDLCVKKALEPVAGKDKLPPEQELDIDPVPVHSIKSLPVVLVVVGLRDGGAPVDHQRFHHIFRDPGTADIVLLRLFIGFVTKLHFGKIRRLEQVLYAGELLLGRVPGDVITVYGVVHDLELDIGLHGLGVAVKVQSQIFANLPLFRRSLRRDGVDLLLQLPFHFFQLFNGQREMRLLLFKGFGPFLQQIVRQIIRQNVHLIVCQIVRQIICQIICQIVRQIVCQIVR